MLALETLQSPVLPALHTALAPLLQEISLLGMEGKTPKHLGTADQVPLCRLESGAGGSISRYQAGEQVRGQTMEPFSYSGTTWIYPSKAG